ETKVKRGQQKKQNTQSDQNNRRRRHAGAISLRPAPEAAAESERIGNRSPHLNRLGGADSINDLVQDKERDSKAAEYIQRIPPGIDSKDEQAKDNQMR